MSEQTRRRVSALCIGGPMDGRNLTGEWPTWTVAERPKISDSLPSSAPVKPLEMKTYTYYVMPFGPFVVWVYDKLNSDEALAMILDGYRR